MPCYDPRDDEDNRQNKAWLDEATRLLCMACRKMDESKMDPEIRQWWKCHKADDEKRIARQNAKEEIATLEELIRQLGKELHVSMTELHALRRRSEIGLTDRENARFVEIILGIDALESKAKKFNAEIEELRCL